MSAPRLAELAELLHEMRRAVDALARCPGVHADFEAVLQIVREGETIVHLAVDAAADVSLGREPDVTRAELSAIARRFDKLES